MSFLLSPIRASSRTFLKTSPALSRTFTTSRPSQLARMTLVGRIGSDPELVQTANGGELIKYVIGHSSGPPDNRQTSWFRVASFAAKDTPLRTYTMGLAKGTLIYFEGDASLKTYEDSEGKKQTALNLVQTKVDVLKRANRPEEAAGESEATS